MDTVRERFDRNVKAKATIGGPFTLDDVAASIDAPVSDLRSSWLTPFANAGTIRAVGTAPSRNPKSRGRHITVWQGTYYLDLEEAERRELAQKILDEYEAEHGVITEEEIASLEQEWMAAS